MSNGETSLPVVQRENTQSSFRTLNLNFRGSLLDILLEDKTTQGEMLKNSHELQFETRMGMGLYRLVFLKRIKSTLHTVPVYSDTQNRGQRAAIQITVEMYVKAAMEDVINSEGQPAPIKGKTATFDIEKSLKTHMMTCPLKRWYTGREPRISLFDQPTKHSTLENVTIDIPGRTEERSRQDMVVESTITVQTHDEGVLDLFAS